MVFVPSQIFIEGVMNRLQQLETFLSEDPTDPFTQYALALEYLKVDINKARQIFESLLQHQPDYLPTYYPYAHLMIDLQNNTLAEELFQKGIALAARENNNKARMELQSAYNLWLSERE